MAAKCPNKKSKDWGDLVNVYGEEGAYEVFIKNGYNVPSLQGWDNNHFVAPIKQRYKLDNIPTSKAEEIVKEIRDNYVGNYYVESFSENDTTSSIFLGGRPLEREAYNDYISNENTDNTQESDPYKRYEQYSNYVYGTENGDPSILPKDVPGDSELLDYKEQRDISDIEKFNRQEFEALVTRLYDTMPLMNEVIEDRSLDGAGQLEPNGIVRVNPELMIETTIGHEYGHLLIDLRGGLGNKFIADAYEQIADTQFAFEIRRKLEERGVSEEKIKKEILAEAIGKETIDMFREEQDNSKFMNTLTRLFRWLGARLGITKNNARELASELLYGKGDAKTHIGRQSDFIQRQETERISKEDLDLVREQAETLIEIEEDIVNKQDSRILEKLSKVRNSAVKTTQSLLDDNINRGRTDYIPMYEEMLKQVDDDSRNDLKASLLFLNNMEREINAMYASFLDQSEKAVQEGDPISLKQLEAWYNAASSFTILEDMQTLINTYSMSEDKGYNKKLKDRISNLISKRNTLKNEYAEIGSALLVDSLSDYSTHTIGTVKEEKMAEWRKANIGNKKKNFKTEAEWNEAQKKYADDYIKDNYVDIIQRNKDLLKSQMDQASLDTTYLRRWLDTMLNSNDVVLSSMMRKIVVKDGIARERARTRINVLKTLTEEIYKNAGHSSLTGNMAEIWDEILEKDENNHRTGHLISPIKSSMKVAYQDFLETIKDKPLEDRKKEIQQWNDENRPLNKRDYYTEKNNEVYRLYKDGNISEKEWNKHVELMENNGDIVLYNFHLNEDAAAHMRQWHKNNVNDYISVISKWRNDDFFKFRDKMDADPNNPMGKVYDLIMDAKKEIGIESIRANQFDTALPFILKSALERKGSGQSAKSLGKEMWDNATKRRLDDSEHGQFTDMNDKPISFVPWNYDRPRGNTREYLVTYNDPISEYKEGILEDMSKDGKEAKIKPKKRYIKATSVEEANDIFKRNSEPGSTIIDTKEGKIMEWTDADQSYDILGVMSSYLHMAYKHIEMDKILPEVELAKHISTSRDYVKRDFRDNPIVKAVGLQGKTRPLTIKGADSQTAAMFSDFVDMVVYGQSKVDSGNISIMGMEFNKSVMADTLAKYSSINMLGINLMQGVSNVAVGEVNQIIEGFAGEYYTLANLHKATEEYTKQSIDIVGDIGSLTKDSVVTHLVDKWDIMNEYENGVYVEGSRFGRLMNTSTLFFMSNAGEHFMQTRTMMAMLLDKKAYDKNGKELGNMYDMYSVKDNNLVLNENVDLKESKWGEEEQELFGARVKEVLARVHGRYSSIGKSAFQRTAIGRLAIMFRKFVMPGYYRRFETKRYHNLLENSTEGSYVTAGKFIGRLFTEFKAMRFNTVAANWNELSIGEKANMKRTLAEVSSFFTFMALGSLFLSLKGEAPDEDKGKYTNLAVWALRVKTELGFFANPSDALKILKTPAVSLSTIDNVISLISNIFLDWGTYERGSWEGHHKITKDVVNMIPVVNQIFKHMSLEDKLVYLQ